MKKLFIITMAFVTLSSFAAPPTTPAHYIIEKVNKGTQFLKPGQQFAGYLMETYNSVCGAEPSKGRFGAQACAVVTPGVGQENQPTYYIEEGRYVTGTPAKNLVGFIEGTTKKGAGLGGNTATGVYRVEK